MSLRPGQIEPDSTERAAVAPRRNGAGLLGAAGMSLLIHAAAMLALGGATWTLARPGTGDREYSAELVEPLASPRSGQLEFSADDSAQQRPRAVQSDGPTLDDLAGSTTGEEPGGPTAVRGTVGSGLGELAVDRLGGGDIVPFGRSADGDGSGLGRRDVTGGGSVGALWGAGDGRTARSVIYVMDRSGSMGDTFAALQKELMRAIGTLGEDQSFNVIWFSEGKPTDLFGKLRPAAMDAKRDAFDAIKMVSARGQTEPVEAVRRAMAYRPDVMYLLSDGDFGDQNAKLISLIRRMNKAAATKIHTILFVYDTLDEGERVLRQIADENRGTFKHVTQYDIRPPGADQRP